MSAVAKVWEVLGGEKLSPSAPSSSMALLLMTKKGLPFASLESVARTLDRSVEATAGVINIPLRTLYVRKNARRFKPDESERVLRLAMIAAEAEDVLGSREKAQRWLAKPSRALGGETPEALLGTELGAQFVRDELSRIEHGVYA